MVFTANTSGYIDKEAGMNEDFSKRDWADNHATVSDGIHRALRTIMHSLKVLNEKQFEAPWRHNACQKECSNH